MHRVSARPAPLDFLLPSSHSAYGIDRRKDNGVPQKAFKFPGYTESAIRDGLHTPPADDMATTYQHPQYPPYGARQESAYSAPGSMSSYDRGYSGSTTQGRQYSVASQHPLSQASSGTVSASTLRNDPPSSQAPYRQPASPPPTDRSNTLAPPEELPRRKNASGDAIVPSLQIPSSINNSGGSLAEFAAQITSLFWFETTETLNKAENLSPSSPPVQRLRDEAVPSSGFRKWVVTILSTTQVTQNVILLALLFIYRLKKINPTVKGRSGSEYRLLTVALMLGNKFLDDNTYTNKTWAEVSGISVTEIHVMEVEFLSNMRYSLLASAEQWQEWQEKLGKFWTYCDRASKAPLPQAGTAGSPPLPSPTDSIIHASSPSLTSGYSSSSNGHSQRSQQWPTTNYSAPLTSPLPNIPDLHSSGRKRSADAGLDEPLPKRVTRPATTGPTAFPLTMPPMRHDAPRLPVPNLTISTSQPSNNGYNGATSKAQHAPVLPPLNGRAMSAVYAPSTPSSTPSWTPNLPALTPTGPSNQYGPHGANGYTTPSRRHSPHSVHDLLQLGSSPISGHFPGHNPGHISPSFFLQQRNSPYKPVRHVNTLLYPPPSASMHDYSANVDQMHYQPLGRRNDYRPGVVPEYTSHPPYQHWPILPQPNFHS